MKKFLFEFEAVLRLRCSERDVCRQALGAALRRDAELSRREGEVEELRAAQIDELRSMEASGGFDVEASRLRRDYAGRLAAELAAIARDRERAAEAIDRHRCDLIAADRKVQSLEKLAARRKIEFEAQEERREALAGEEAWRALHPSPRS